MLSKKFIGVVRIISGYWEFIDIIIAHRFTDFYDADNFFMNIYCPHCTTLNPSELLQILSIQSHGLYIDNDLQSIKTINKCITTFPELPYNIIGYRSGVMKDDNRPYISATVLYDVAERYCNHNLHVILIQKGSKIIPLHPIIRSLHKPYVNDGEFDTDAEIILDASKLVNIGKYFIYHK